jgi:signal transduction histidine kinase
MKRLPFRRRLTVWSTLVAAVALLVCGVVAGVFVYHGEVRELDSTLEVESRHFFSEINRHGAAKFDWRRIETEINEWMPPTQPPRYMEIRTGDVVRWRSKNLAAPGFAAHGAGWSNVKQGGESLRLLVRDESGITFAIASNLQDAHEVIFTLGLALLAGLPVALAFAWLGGRRLAAAAVAPVEEMARAAERVTANRFDQRVPVPAVPDEIQRLAHVLNATLDRLERSYQQALRFSADASHELKTPLTVLRSSIEAVLDSSSLGDNERAAIEGLMQQTKRLTNITTSLLLLARADAGRLVMDVREHDLAVLTEACVEDARIMAEAHNVKVRCELPAYAPARVDALRYSQIASNLLDNAVKYNQRSGEVRVTLSDGGTAWRLSVANTGQGIAAEHRVRLFERFFRAEHSTEDTGHGLGLGLARELARAHGGDVVLMEGNNGWTEFVATLPKQPGASEATHGTK